MDSAEGLLQDTMSGHQQPEAKSWLLILIIAALYVATARLGLTLAMPPENKATAVWPPSGIALAALLLAGRRVWPGIWLGAFLANLWDALSPTTSFSLAAHVTVSAVIAVGSTLQAFLASMLLQRVTGPATNFLERTRTVFQFVGITLLVCLVASTIGVLSLALGGFASWSQYPLGWLTWWLGDSVGILLVTPLILSWGQRGRWLREPRRITEAVVLAGLLLVVGLLVFGGRDSWSPAYLAVPLVVWAAFRFGPRGATACLVLLSACAVWGTVRGRGPFIESTLHESLLAVQAFVAVLAVTALSLMGVLEERRQAEEAKAELIEELERASSEIKTLRGLIPICAWCKKIRNDRGAWEQLESYLRDNTEATFSHGICPDCLEGGHVRDSGRRV